MYLFVMLDIVLYCIMSKNHKVITILTKSTDQHKFHENRNWNKFENSEVHDNILYFEY
jgi:hypothetical protein